MSSDGRKNGGEGEAVVAADEAAIETAETVEATESVDEAVDPVAEATADEAEPTGASEAPADEPSSADAKAEAEEAGDDSVDEDSVDEDSVDEDSVDEGAAERAADDEVSADVPVEAPPIDRIIEALLFATSEPLGLTRLSAILQEYERAEVKDAVERLRTAADEEGRAYSIEEIGGGYRLLTRPSFDPYLRRLQKVSSGEKLSAAAVETLAIIAYKQPVIKAEIDAIRGVKCDGTIQKLLKTHLIRMVGRAEVLGRPLLYGTTKAFLDQFGLKSLDELPSVREALEKINAAEQPGVGEESEEVEFDDADPVEDELLEEALPDVPEFSREEQPAEAEGPEGGQPEASPEGQPESPLAEADATRESDAQSPDATAPDSQAPDQAEPAGDPAVKVPVTGGDAAMDMPEPDAAPATDFDQGDEPPA